MFFHNPVKIKLPQLAAITKKPCVGETIIPNGKLPDQESYSWSWVTINARKELELRFQDVHSDFYDKLNKLFPDLLPNELKLCAFLQLNMSTKEISTITFQSAKSITMARFRLRKKMDIGNYENLIAYLGQL